MLEGPHVDPDGHGRSPTVAVLIRQARIFLLTSCLAVIGSPCFGVETPPPPRTLPVIRGTLWWVGAKGPSAPLSKDLLAAEIQAQADVGFNLLWVCNAPQLMQMATEKQIPFDPLEVIFGLADQKGLKVIVGLNKAGGHWFGRIAPETLVAETVRFIQEVHERYGNHRSFHGWYLNHEINPIHPADEAPSAFWRQVWKGIVAECHRVAPGSIVTISPFFLLDAERKRGFVYLTPAEYEQWWSRTLAGTGIDVIMLQDSGEHLAFFTLEDRESYFAAFARACEHAGKTLWINVESAQIEVADWQRYLDLERLGSKEPKARIMPWKVTSMDWLERKLRLAARYGTGIVNWGYYPFMDPNPAPGPYAASSPRAYQAYKTYYERTIRQSKSTGDRHAEASDESQ
jgi:hypothetical protein